MNKRSLIVLILVLVCFVAVSCTSVFPTKESVVCIVISNKASSLEKLAAKELARYLGKIYPKETFAVTKRQPEGFRFIQIGTVKSRPWIAELMKVKPDGAESYVVTGSTREGVVLGADDTGLIYGVYALLEKLGCGFYLSYETVPEKDEMFSFNNWDLRDSPLVKDRIVFNWHNFLSGCTAWDLEDWQKWINQSQKMGYNTIMVHAYGNNPMFDFEFNGVRKPTGVLTDTSQGHEWGTAVVNDVRRMTGGELYDGPVFGSKAARVSKEKMPATVQSLMKKVFKHAEERGMKICFAFDVATSSANPRCIYQTMQPETLIDGKLVNPDTEEGFAYYKAQMKALMNTYPQIDTFGFWMRVGAEYIPKIPLHEMPDTWKAEYDALKERAPALKKMDQADVVFIYGKMADAYREVLDELGYENVRMLAGSWRFYWWPAANECFAKDIAVLGLDTELLYKKSQVESKDGRKIIAEVAKNRDAIPVAWSHHDDGAYIGGMFTPHENYYDKLSGASGFGVIHWMMHPFDIYLKSLGAQVWSSSKNQPLNQTIKKMSERVFGKASDEMAAYLEEWVVNAPVFGRETTPFFVTNPVEDVRKVVRDCKSRIGMLDLVLAMPLKDSARKKVQYFKQLERFIIDFYQDQEKLQGMAERLNKRKLDDVREILEEVNPEQTVEQYVKAIASIETDKGEKGYLFQLNTDWLPYFTSIRQAVGLESTRINFAPENFDELAQAASQVSLFVSEEGEYWAMHGAKKTKADILKIPEYNKILLGEGMPAVYREVCKTGVTSEGPISFSVRPITHPRGFPGKMGFKVKGFSAGSYELKLLFVEPYFWRATDRVFDVEITSNTQKVKVEDSIDIFKNVSSRFKVLEKVYAVELEDNGYVNVTLNPQKGNVVICGAILDPK